MIRDDAAAVTKRGIIVLYHALQSFAKLRDDATIYWHLTDVDNAGRFREEVFGNDVLTERSYFEGKQRLKSITTERGATTVQSLAL